MQGLEARHLQNTLSAWDNHRHEESSQPQMLAVLRRRNPKLSPVVSPCGQPWCAPCSSAAWAGGGGRPPWM